MEMEELSSEAMYPDPKARVSAAPSSLEGGSHAPQINNGVKVLVPEDSPEIQFLLDSILSSAGAQVVVVNNGREAIATAAANEFDVILMDIQMPEVDGYEATREIRASGYRKSIIAVTAHAMAEERLKTSAAGCNHHLIKPLQAGQLLMTIQNSVLMNSVTP